MQRRGTRIAILCLLLAAGGLAGFVAWSAEREVHRLDRERDAKSTTIDALLSSISTIAGVQQAYTDYGHRDVGPFARVSLIVDRITTDAAGLRATPGSRVNSERLEEFWTALSALMSAESRARERLAGGDEAGAADAVLASAREHVNVLGSSLRAFRTAELHSYQTMRAAAALWSWVALSVLVTLWAGGLVAFALWPRHQTVDAVAIEPPAAIDVPAPASVVEAVVPTVDLTAAAALSKELSQLIDLTALPGLLAKTADILGARGAIVWIGSGEDLFAAAAHGYDEALLKRIRPIARDAANVTAAAWRSGELLTLPADAGGYGAVVAPLLSPAGCVGVLAVEVSGDRDRDPATQAVATILASQFAGVLATPSVASPAEERPLNRQAAAS
jgi:hypothetical protein